MQARTVSLLVGILAALSVLASACGDDDGAAVRDLGEGSESGSESSSSSASSSAPAAGPAETIGDGGYEYATNVDSHRLVVVDLCGIGDLLDAGDFDAVEAIYREGENSVKSDGTIRTIESFATRDDANHGLSEYYGTPTPLDEFITAAFDAADSFSDETDDVRAQGVEKGMQNQTMVAWTIHELNSAINKAAEGDFDLAEGAVHNWDEGWAFFHGAEPGCAPYATGDKRAANFGTNGEDDMTALANEAILAAMIAGRDSLLAEDTSGAEAAASEVLRNVIITYSQAAIRYASLIEGDLADGDDETARVHQAEGLAFWRVIEAYVEAAGADVDAVNAIFDLANEPGA
ncbi:MAG: FEA1-related lipoprotein, partial [Acidimicrobiales bacterium]